MMKLPDTDKWNHAEHFYDMHLLAYLGAIFDPRRDVIDVGANVGYVSRFFALRSRRTILAIEPSATNFAALVENTADLNNIIYVNAVAGASGSAPVTFLDNGTVCSHVATTNRSAYLREVPVVAVDDFSEQLDVGLLKIDVEGYEMIVLQSARKLIEKHRPIIAIETEPKWLKRFGVKVADVFDFFKDMGYQKPVNKFGKREDPDSCMTDQIFAPVGLYLPRPYLAYEKWRRDEQTDRGSPGSSESKYPTG